MTTLRQAAATRSHEGAAVDVAVASSTLSWRRPQQEVEVQPRALGLLPRTNNLSVSAVFVEKVHRGAQSVHLTATSEATLHASASPPRGPN